MVGYYTRDFRTAKADLAAEYLVLICLNADLEGEAGKSQASLCYEALREIVLETREYALLLGDIRSDGQRINGIIELRLKLISLTDQDEFLRVITLQAAAVADDSGRITDAVLLYHLAEDYDSAITIINRALSDALSVDIDAAPMRLAPLKPRTETASRAAADQAQSDTSLSLTSVDDPIILARDMTALYNSNALYYRKIKQANREACGLLLRMHEVRSKVASGQWAVIEVSSLYSYTAQIWPGLFPG